MTDGIENTNSPLDSGPDLAFSGTQKAPTPPDEQPLLILQSMGDYAVLTTDLERRVSTWSQGAQTIFGYTEQQIVGQSADLLFTPEDRESGAPEQEIQTAIDQGRAENERWHCRRDGSRLYGSGMVTPLYDQAGNSIGLVKVVRDRTAQKQAEDALRQQEEHTRLAVEAAQMATWEWHLVTDLVYWNEEHFRLLGMPVQPNPLKSEAFLSHIHPDDRESVTAQLIRAIEQRGIYDADLRIIRDDGVTRWMSGYGRITGEEDGRPTRMSGVMFDITERKTLEEALKEADRRKDEFLAMLSHELRNPLATLSNTLMFMELTGGEDAVLPLGVAFKMMNREVMHLNRMVDDLLDVSRISQGASSLRIEPVEMRSLVNEAVEAIQYLYQDRELGVSLSREPIYVGGDSTRLTQVLTNLLTNAAKFTPSGGHIQVTLEQGANQVLMRVRDNGIGLAADQLSRIFDLFVQVDMSLDRAPGGLGLGLAVVKKLVEQHGGRVTVHSAGLGQGTEFIVFLPKLPEGAERVSRPNRPLQEEGKSRRVLIVDDNQAVADTTAMLLKLKGHQVHTYYDGKESIGAAEQLRPDVVLLDVGMPEVDGYEVCRLIRQQPWGKGLFLIALTGYGQAVDVRRSKDAGFNQHLAKPLDLMALTELLDSLPA